MVTIPPPLLAALPVNIDPVIAIVPPWMSRAPPPSPRLDTFEANVLVDTEVVSPAPDPEWSSL